MEDEARVRKLIVDVLTARGYRVLEATRGEEALRLAKLHSGSIELALVDVVMPEMSGPDLVRKIHPLRPKMRVLYISGYTDEAIVHHGIPESGAAFLQKPFLPDALARKVREVLDTRIQFGPGQGQVGQTIVVCGRPTRARGLAAGKTTIACPAHPGFRSRRALRARPRAVPKIARYKGALSPCPAVAGAKAHQNHPVRHGSSRALNTWLSFQILTGENPSSAKPDFGIQAHSGHRPRRSP